MPANCAKSVLKVLFNGVGDDIKWIMMMMMMMITMKEKSSNSATHWFTTFQHFLYLVKIYSTRVSMDHLTMSYPLSSGRGFEFQYLIIEYDQPVAIVLETFKNTNMNVSVYSMTECSVFANKP